MTRPPLSSALAALLLLAAAASPAAARGMTQDDVLQGALLSGWQMKSGHHMAAVRLDLAPGWKTYWRSPGDAGIPPRFDWSGSENLKSVRLLWPSPTIFHTNGYQTIGYRGDVVLPVEIEPQDPTRPVHLRAVMELGICQDICIPAQIEMSADVSPPGAPDPAIRAALEARPKSGAEAGLSAISCEVAPVADGLSITATIALPRQPGDEAVAFEAADPAVWVSEAETTRHGNTLVARAEMVAPSGQPFALDRSGVTVTVIHDGGSVEIAGCPAP